VATASVFAVIVAVVFTRQARARRSLRLRNSGPVRLLYLGLGSGSLEV
jgi:hypothetical protein